MAVDIQCSVVSGVNVSSDISYPYIESHICQEVPKRQVREISNPSGPSDFQTMLKEYHWSSGILGNASVFSIGDSMDS